MSAFIDKTNRRFGKLTARWPSGILDRRIVLWLCSCECGKISLVRTDGLVPDGTQSCGCLRKERTAAANRKRVGPVHESFRHGHCVGGNSTPEYKAYEGARRRCVNPNDPAYKYYGGRGIRFLFQSFEEFLNHIGGKPSPELQIDRIDNNGHYEIGNVRWATPLQNMHNRRPYRHRNQYSRKDE